MSTETVPILLDTDIGSDIDDAVALAYLLKQPKCNLLGITTVTGNTVERAAMAEIVCRAGGREDIPIYAGLRGPILHGPGQPNSPQYDAIKHLPHRTEYGPSYEAIDFLRQTIRSRPGEITLFAIGPMTNVAALFTYDPEIPSLLKSLVLMCGVFTGKAGHGPGDREWNALCDPIAAGIVYKQGNPLSIGLEVTTKCTMPADECRTKFRAAGGALNIVADMAEVWFQHINKITFHDPLAATVIFDPEICKCGPGKVTVVTDMGPLEGMTRWNALPGGPHQIAYTVDSERFFAHYFEVVGG